jgi:cytochrome-b5 reductase
MMEPPVPPDASDCCNSGCTPCILDVYDAQLKKYEQYCKNNNNLQGCELEIVNSISPTSYTSFKLIEHEQLSPTVFLLKFTYDDSLERVPNCFRYAPGQYLLLRAKDSIGEFTRAYTPIPVTSESDLGFTIIVRCYNDGRMSKLLQKLQIGHKTSWRGPYGDFIVNYKYKHLFFIAQGTGIAPLFAIINEIVHNEDRENFIKLFFCCRDCGDILLRDHLYKLSSYWNFSYEVFLSSAANINQKYNEMIHGTKLTTPYLRNYVNGKTGELQAIICGSDNFSEHIKSQLENLGIESNNIHLF